MAPAASLQETFTKAKHVHALGTSISSPHATKDMHQNVNGSIIQIVQKRKLPGYF